MSTALQIAPIMIALASLCWVAFVATRKGDIHKATLRLELGLTNHADDMLLPGETKTKRIERTTMVLVGRLERGETGLFSVFLTLDNRGKTSIKNVRVLMDFSRDHCLRDLSVLSSYEFRDKRRVKGAMEGRHVTANGGYSKVVHDLALLRPGEAVTIDEPMLFGMPESKQGEDGPTGAALGTRLRRAGVSQYFAVDVFVTAENCMPTARRFNILWINSDRLPGAGSYGELQQSNDVLEKINEAFWGGYPAPGSYLKSPFRPPFWRWEAAEIVELALVTATHQGATIRVAEHAPFSLGIAKLPMPQWNYHEETRPDFDRFFHIPKLKVYSRN